ncbi:hypothetical protein QCA50_012401 [Cerrena zonata]|uniref:Uncharacterized protein n=1 Tax=Cerrena zonata TaxID=2478898 RepID=A0AAW0FZD2_9APHY
MVFLPRFWGGLPYPPSYLVEASKALRFKDEMDTSDLPTLSRKYPSTPNIASSSPHEVTRLAQSESPTPIGQPLEEVTTIGSDDALVKMALFQVLQDKT